MKGLFNLVRFLLIICLFTGCRKDLCYDHEDHAFSVKVYAEPMWKLEWEYPYAHNWQEKWPFGLDYTYDELRPEIPEGVVAKVRGKNNYMAETNFMVSGGKLPLLEGEHSILMYNNDTEYIIFDGFDSHKGMTATTRTLSRASYKPQDSQERTINTPDMLYGYYVENYDASPSYEKIKLPVFMEPLVFTYVVKITISKGRKYVVLARGALTGMAEKIYIHDGHTDDSKATVLFDCKLTDYGAVAYVKTFGLPDYPENFPEDGNMIAPFWGHKLNFEMKLKNGKLKSVDIDISNQIKNQPRGGVIIVSGIEISDEEGEVEGGFDVNVDGWGEAVDIPVELD